jgi:hypothetical protein
MKPLRHFCSNGGVITNFDSGVDLCVKAQHLRVALGQSVVQTNITLHPDSRACELDDGDFGGCDGEKIVELLVSLELVAQLFN